jgi:DNA-binding SARP family transcriptional activator
MSSTRELMKSGDAWAAPSRGQGSGAFIRLLQGFELWVGSHLVVIPQHAQRVIAFLAVHGRPQLRTKVAFSLWADSTEDRARASLRTALWKINGLDLVDVRGSYIGISDTVDVDLHALLAQAKRLIAGGGPVQDGDADPDGLVGDLLPDWDEDWLQFERERLRQLRLHALEALSARLSASGRHAESIDAAQAAVAAEPLRESAQRTLIKAHLAEGNVCEARRQRELTATRWRLPDSRPEGPPMAHTGRRHR